MNEIQKNKEEIRKLEYIQKHRVSKEARRNIIGELANRVVKNNQMLQCSKDKDADRSIMDRNKERAKDMFNKHAGSSNTWRRKIC